LGWSLKHRFEVMAIILMFIAITGAAMQNGPQSGDEGGGISDINLIFDLAGNYTQEEIDDYMGAVEDTLFANATRYKLRALDTGYRKTFGRIRVFLEDPEDDQWYEIAGTGLLSLIGLHDDNDMPKDSIIADIKRRMPTKPGIKMRTSWRSGDTDEGGSVSIFLYGDDTGKLTELAAEVERRMELLEGVISVETDQEIGTDEVKISMDREIVTRNGINPTEVASSLMYAVRGFNLPRYQATDRDVQVLVQLQEKDRQNLNQLKNMTFFSSSGQPVPLSALASFTMEKGFGEIHRRDGKTYMRVRAQTTSEDMQNIARQIDAFMEDFPMPVGYDWQKGNSFRDLDDLGAAFKVSILLALVFVYLVMAILFESLVYPLSVIISIPLAFFGAFMALAITQTGLGLMAIIGIIILIGVVVNNGIILVDMINRKRAEGFSRTDAIMEAGRNRFRPILMTTFTTIGGLIPMAIGTAELFTGLPYYPMGRAIIGGMLTSAMLTLVVVPVFYTLLDDLSVWLSRFFGIIAAKTRSKGAAIQ
ncbi:MAG TPA: efflux RND transporter permease subunit, partial [Calditrichia bacterium]|nr:efflux RND transporter permease subunit [Calditrichia bacterium]